ncbi:MAG: ribonuclease III [Pseudomonadota bacterium]
MGIDKEILKQLKKFEKVIGYRFKNKALLKRALSHKSYVNELGLPAFESNERLEYLGDAVLELSISHLLINKFKEKPEGELSKMRAAVVNEEILANLAREISLGQMLFLGRGEDNTGGREKPSILSDAFEAVLGAIYLDRNYEKAKKVVERLWCDLLEETGAEGFIRDYKTRAQEVFQSKFRSVPHYKLVKQSGPDHSKTFEVELFVQERLMGKGAGKSKKSAEQEAARAALEKLEGGKNE